MKMTNEQLQIAKNAKSAEELIALAREHGFEQSPEKMKEIYETLHNRNQLSDAELENVDGGFCRQAFPNAVCPACGHVGMDENLGFTGSWTHECPACGGHFRIDDSGNLMPCQ